MSKKTILVVEDNVELSKAIVYKLQGAGYNVMSASNGREALEALEGGEPLDLICLDMYMPEMDGREFLHAIKENESYHSVPIFAVTVSVNPEHFMKVAKELNLAAHFVKSDTSLDEILERINKELEK